MEICFLCSYFLRIFMLSILFYYVFLYLNLLEFRCCSKILRGGVLNFLLVIYE